jgi:hypothetical protein
MIPANFFPRRFSMTGERDQRSEPAATTSVLPTINGYFPGTPFFVDYRKAPCPFVSSSSHGQMCPYGMGVTPSIIR